MLISKALLFIVFVFLRGFDYQVNERGLLQSISPCQCLPRTENTSLALSGIQFACPVGKVDPVSGEVTLIFSKILDFRSIASMLHESSLGSLGSEM